MLRQIDIDESTTIDGNTIRQRDDASDYTFRLPRRAQVIGVLKLSNGLARLTVGSFSRTHISVTGPVELIEKLRSEVT